MKMLLVLFVQMLDSCYNAISTLDYIFNKSIYKKKLKNMEGTILNFTCVELFLRWNKNVEKVKIFLSTHYKQK